VNSLAVFDLDDTLIDTRGLLVPAALRAVARAAGVPEERLRAGGKRIDEILAGIEGLDEARRAAAAAAWYDPEVPPIDLMPGARTMLAALRGRIHLALLTRGDPRRQDNKIEACGARPLFEAVRIRPIEEPGTKADDLRDLMNAFGVAPPRTVVIGDDPRDELRHGRALGCRVLLVPEVSLDEIPVQLQQMGLLAGGC